MEDVPMSEAELEKFVGVLRKRQSRVEHLIEVADTICRKLEEGATVAPVSIEIFRGAIEGVKNNRLLGS